MPYKQVAALESHGGKRFCRLKATFRRPEMLKLMAMARTGVSGKFELTTAPRLSDDDSQIFRKGVTDK